MCQMGPTPIPGEYAAQRQAERDAECPRCGETVETWQSKGWIDGDRAHAQCVLDEMDECGMDDFHGDN